MVCITPLILRCRRMGCACCIDVPYVTQWCCRIGNRHSGSDFGGFYRESLKFGPPADRRPEGADSEAVPIRIPPKSGPEARFPARKHLCVTQCRWTGGTLCGCNTATRSLHSVLCCWRQHGTVISRVRRGLSRVIRGLSRVISKYKSAQFIFTYSPT